MIITVHEDLNPMMLVARGDQKIGKSRVKAGDMIGHPYGSVFEIQGHRLVRIEGSKFSFDTTLPEEDGGTGDNSFYNDSNTAQKLSQEEILEMRENGKSGVDILRSLVKNSETWSSKTSFAQEKWLKRKSKKYVTTLLVEKSTPATLCSVYFAKARAKVCHMRWDILAQLLSFSEIHAGSRVLVIESLIGLLTGSVAYRLRGQGAVASIFCGQQPHLEMVEWLNLTTEEASIIKSIPSSKLGTCVDYVKKHGFVSPKDDAPLERLKLAQAALEEVDEALESDRERTEGIIESQPEKKRKVEKITRKNGAGFTHVKEYKRLARTPLEVYWEENFLCSGFDRFICLWMLHVQHTTGFLYFHMLPF